MTSFDIAMINVGVATFMGLVSLAVALVDSTDTSSQVALWTITGVVLFLFNVLFVIVGGGLH